MMRMFTMVRNSDESGVSGTGRVLDGVVFHNGKVVICWRTDIDGSKHGRSTLGVYDCFDDFKFIHVDSHPTNDTEIIWGEDPDRATAELNRLREALLEIAITPPDSDHSRHMSEVAQQVLSPGDAHE